jgi:hypothetical protein
MVCVRYPSAKIGYKGDRPVALLKVRIAPSYHLVDQPLGTPTTSARTARGTWALYQVGAEAWASTPTEPSAASPLMSRPRSAAWPPRSARVSWTGRPPRPSSSPTRRRSLELSNG